MSWNIHILTNNVKVPEEAMADVALEIVRAAPEKFEDANALTDRPDALNMVFYGGKLAFDPDDMEWVDYVTRNPEVCAALARAGAVGRLAFGCLDGDDAGSFWGVDFAAGHYRPITANPACIKWQIGTSVQG